MRNENERLEMEIAYQKGIVEMLERKITRLRIDRNYFEEVYNDLGEENDKLREENENLKNIIQEMATTIKKLVK